MNPNIILASSSPRRRELLQGLGLSFSIQTPDVEEIPLPGEAPAAYVARNAKLKANAVHRRQNSPADAGLVVVAADTIVVLDDKILEKPVDATHAQSMLSRLSNRTHKVLTGLHVISGQAGAIREFAQVVTTSVVMKALKPEEIRAYVATGEPMDKAGSYAAQGQGGYMVKAIQGSYTNVVGLPLTELVEILTEHCAVTLFA